MLDKLIPPDDPQKVTAWRYFVAGVVLVLLVNAAVGRGLIAPGMAYATAGELSYT